MTEITKSALPLKGHSQNQDITPHFSVAVFPICKSAILLAHCSVFVPKEKGQKTTITYQIPVNNKRGSCGNKGMPLTSTAGTGRSWKRMDTESNTESGPVP